MLRNFAWVVAATGAICWGVSGGCASSKPSPKPAVHPVEPLPPDVAQRAAFELDCAPAGIQFMRLDPKTIGASGCGQRAIYVELCHSKQDVGASLFLQVPVSRQECQWVLNGMSQSDDAAR